LATILMAWELGEGLGHVQRLVRIGRGLAEHGHRVVFALANVVEPWPLLQKDSFAVLQAPHFKPRPRHGESPFQACSFADVLAVRGWETVETLVPLVEAWRHLLETVQPQLIVTDFAPTQCLAAYQAIPVVQVGNWFTMPPVHAATFPLLMPGQPPVLPQEDLLAVVQEVQRRRGQSVPPTLTSILSGGDRFPSFFPELDPYNAERIEPVWDPIEPIAPLTAAKAEKRFFAYLTAENSNAEAYLTQMALTGCRGTVYLRSASAEMKDRLRLQGLTVLDEPAPMAEMLAQSAVLVHHGGSTANSAFAAGRPQILFPQHLEQATTARILAKLGVGVFLLGNAAPEAAGRALRQILGDRRYADNAIAGARRIHERPRRPVLPALVECCLSRLKDRP
jgi:rhamnosyltransferase subunit B